MNIYLIPVNGNLTPEPSIVKSDEPRELEIAIGVIERKQK